ncbi:MAG TPA: S8 family peptidase [Chthoniobacteraceae bacterium]|nr:S8 family peptidase [Chthoniobacteraceae bacterium]
MLYLPPIRVEATFLSLAETVDWSLTAYRIPDHWKRTRGQGVRIALLDTGIDEAHPDLIDALDDARDFTRSRSGPIDRHGHGTHTAGTIAARQNGVGVIGVAPECRLLVGKVLGDDGAGSTMSVAAGIDWACDSGADIVSLSLGSPEPERELLSAVERAASKGKFIIAAAGNDGRDQSVNYPARWRDTIAVAAVDENGRLSKFSSRGEEVDIAAPGENILSTWLRGGYARLSGTSMATPFVAGVVALALAAHRQVERITTPLRTVRELREHLARTATDAGPSGKDPGYGWGLINPDALLAFDADDSDRLVSPAPIDGGVWVWIPGAVVSSQ